METLFTEILSWKEEFWLTRDNKTLPKSGQAVQTSAGCAQGCGCRADMGSARLCSAGQLTECELC